MDNNEKDSIDYLYSGTDDNYYQRAKIHIEERRLRVRRQRMRNNLVGAAIVMVVALTMLIFCVRCSGKKTSQTDAKTADNSNNASAYAADGNSGKAVQSQSAAEKKEPEKKKVKIETKNGMTFVEGILVVNKTYSLPSDYAPGVSSVANNAFNQMSADAANEGITLFVNSSYRSYWEQAELYNTYVYQRGKEEADKVSSRPGHSEHQTGLTFDVNTTEFSFENTPEAKWLAENCWKYGFIIRYPKGKEDITGYAYEPWHIRYIGKENARKITQSGKCLEEYFGITSKYKD